MAIAGVTSAGTTSGLRSSDLLAVRSRVSWPAVSAGAMVALTIYVVLMLLGMAVGIEVAVRGTDVNLGVGSGLYTVFALAVAMFFGGWATSRLAVGEDQLEAVLHALVLWGVLFIGLFWLVASGVRTGFSALMGVASGTYATAEAAGLGAGGGRFDADRLASDLKEAGLDQAQVDKAVVYYRNLQRDPVGTVRQAAHDPDAQQAGRMVVETTRQATRWTLTGVVVSLLLVIVGSLVGSGEVPLPVALARIRPAVGTPTVIVPGPTTTPIPPTTSDTSPTTGRSL